MAWNQSTGPTKVEPKKPSALKGVVAGVVCVAIAAAVAFFVLSGKDEKPKARVEKEPGRIKEVKPAAAPKAEAQPTKDQVASRGREKAVDQGVKAATNRPDYASMTADEAAKVGYFKSAERLLGAHKRIFKTRSEALVAGIMCAKPGMMMPLIPLPKDFDAEIKAALKAPPLLPTDEDDEYTREHKQAMIDARPILEEAVAQGESLADLIEASRSELRKIADMRQDVVKGFIELCKKGASREELHDYITAGNEILDKYNAQPLGAPLNRGKKVELEKLNGEEAK